MTALKCYNCGASSLEIFDAEKSLYTCLHCDSIVPIPQDANDGKKSNLLTNAARLRQDREFDESLKAYERYTYEDDSNAWVHFSIALCRYGIVFVDDEATGRCIPTCSRYVKKSFLADPSYRRALDLTEAAGDVAMKMEYEKRGQEINRILQKIGAEADREQPYDIFICYKDTDELTQSKTEDSNRGWNLFNILTEKGYRVFFAARSLRRGDDWEPQIFNALNTARVMLVIASKAAYVNAVWVKNEWSRYLDIANIDSGKKIFPLYFNMKPEELPLELSAIQAYDMAQYTFFPDLL
ncbi:MAG: toll/interleukin-1 receptor domain-containing protein, partial [Oscillospiraceae bacterium]|nr:toll/interleukin-1 receptor domain-containing protein [Oscillospiraceae bacterium]